MVGTKSCGYSNSGRLSEGSTRCRFSAPVTALVLSGFTINLYFSSSHLDGLKAICQFSDIGVKIA